MEKTLQLYETIEHSANATSVLFPWFPSLGVFQRTIAGGRLYMIIKGIVDQRIKTGTRSDDPLQMLMDMGDPMPKMVEVSSSFPCLEMPTNRNPVYCRSSLHRPTQQWHKRSLDPRLPRLLPNLALQNPHRSNRRRHKIHP